MYSSILSAYSHTTFIVTVYQSFFLLLGHCFSYLLRLLELEMLSVSSVLSLHFGISMKGSKGKWYHLFLFIYIYSIYFILPFLFICPHPYTSFFFLKESFYYSVGNTSVIYLIIALLMHTGVVLSLSTNKKNKATIFSFIAMHIC